MNMQWKLQGMRSEGQVQLSLSRGHASALPSTWASSETRAVVVPSAAGASRMWACPAVPGDTAGPEYGIAPAQNRDSRSTEDDTMTWPCDMGLM